MKSIAKKIDSLKGCGSQNARAIIGNKIEFLYETSCFAAAAAYSFRSIRLSDLSSCKPVVSRWHLHPRCLTATAHNFTLLFTRLYVQFYLSDIGSYIYKEVKSFSF